MHAETRHRKLPHRYQNRILNIKYIKHRARRVASERATDVFNDKLKVFGFLPADYYCVPPALSRLRFFSRSTKEYSKKKKNSPQVVSHKSYEYTGVIK